MKRLFYILVVFFGTIQIINAQRYSEIQRKKDSLRLDSLCKKNPSQCSMFGELVGVNSIFRNLEKTELKPKETSCFNKKIHYKGIVNHKPVEGCYYLNTDNGLMAKFTNRNVSCSDLTEFHPNYQLEMYSMMGDAFLYSINEKGFKYFSVVPAEKPVGSNTTFIVKDKRSLENHVYTKLSDHQFPTLKYSVQESSVGATYSLFAPVFESVIPVHDYLGAFGTGYYKNQYGNTIISLLMDSDPENYIEIEKIVDVAECFDGSSFESQVEVATNEETQIITRQQNTVEKQMRDTENIPCPARNELLALKKEMLRKEQKAINTLKSTSGGYTPTQMENFAKGNDVIDQATKHKLEAEVKICQLEYSNRQNVSAEYKAKNIIKINCLRNSIAQLNGLITELNDIDNGSSRNLSQKMIEKNRLYITRMETIDLGCVIDNNGTIKPMPKARKILSN